MSVLTVQQVQVDRGGHRVVHDASFAADRGELVALMGASGSGKTTLLRAIAGLEPIAGGAIDLGGVMLRAGQRPRGPLLRDLHRRVGMVFQFHHLFAHMTALQNVTLAPLHVFRQPHIEAHTRARGLLDSLGVGHRIEAMPHELSGGEAQRVAIARALAVDPPVLLMDEPTASLDAPRRAELAATLTELTTTGRVIVVATHDEAFVRACRARVLVIRDGRLENSDRV